MKILVTGSKGFIGKNLIARLKTLSDNYKFYEYDIDSSLKDLDDYTKDCDFVYNFAAVHRPNDNSEFNLVNHLFFDDLLNLLKKHNNTCPVLYTSSIQAINGSEYGNSKLAAENDLFEYGKETGARAIVYRLTNIYGRWATPNHHSVVATFCNNISKGIPIQISDVGHVMNFYYIDDVIDSFIAQLDGKVKPCEDNIYRLSEDKIHTITLGTLADTLYRFENELKQGKEPKTENETERTLLLTYKSYRE